MSHNSQEHNRFLAACSVSRGASLSKKKWKNFSRGQKRAFCSFFYWELSSSFLVFPETNVVLFTNYQRYLNGQSMRQNFFQCEMPEPLLQISLLKKWGETRDVVVKPLPACFATEQSKVKVSLLIRMFRTVTKFARVFHVFMNGP